MGTMMARAGRVATELTETLVIPVVTAPATQTVTALEVQAMTVATQAIPETTEGTAALPRAPDSFVERPGAAGVAGLSSWSLRLRKIA